MDKTLDGKVAIVTGGSRGIGRAMCLGLGAAGANVVVAARTEEDNSAGTQFEKYGSGTIVDTAAQVVDLGGAAFPVRCDVTRSEDLSHLVEAALERFGRIDVVISNAGVDCESPVAELDVDLLDRCLAVNIRAPLLLCKYALPSMIAQGNGGSIFCVTSASANAYRKARVGYSMSKAALERTFFNLAEEVRPHNIAVNVLGPGRVDTWMNRNGDWPGTEQMPMVPADVIIPSAVWLAGQTAETLTGTLVDRADFGQTWGPASPRVQPEPR